MLTYFPTAHPNEWIYSVFCRYHLRAGRQQSQTTIRELFGNRLTAAIGSIFPNNTITGIAAQLPTGQFNARDFMLHHTLFSYYTRCYPLSKKEKLLDQLCQGTTAVITSIRNFGQLPAPRYCPLCAQEDKRIWGEAYWHIEHQIPAMDVCPNHGHPLLSIKGTDATKVRYTFFPLDVSLPASEDLPAGSTPKSSWQLEFSKILYEYATLPLSCAATPGYSNLAIALGNMGYEVIQCRSTHTILDAKRLYHDLIERFGTEIVEKAFGDERSICLLNRVCKWECLTPERYALLQCFAGISSAEMFSSEQRVSVWEEKLRIMGKNGVKYGKKQLCESLGITASQLNILAKKYDITPFWTQNSANASQLHKISIVFDDAEHEQFKRALAQSGFRYDRHFAHHCITEYLTRQLKVKEK